MGLRSLYDRSATTKRLADIGNGSLRQEWEDNEAAFDCTIHPVDGGHTELGDGSYFQLFKMFCAPDVDIIVGDRVISNGDTYEVRAVDQYSFGRNSANHHLRVMIAKGV